MSLRTWLFQIAVLATLVLGSALGAGWKWNIVPH
jgi:hypothetical protein